MGYGVTRTTYLYHAHCTRRTRLSIPGYGVTRTTYLYHVSIPLQWSYSHTHYSLLTWVLASCISQTSFISQQPGPTSHSLSHVTCVAGRFHVLFYLFLRRSMLALCSDYSNTALPCLFWLRPPCGSEPLIADGRWMFLQPHHFSPGPLLPQAEHKCREASEGEASEEEPCACLLFAICCLHTDAAKTFLETQRLAGDYL
jgi:hypothetical protein